MVDRDIEEALDLLRVQIDGQHAVRAGGGEQIGHELGRDRHAGFIFTVLPGITEKGDHRGDARGGRTAHRVDHDEQFHDAVISRSAGGLDDVNVAAADILVDLHERFTVGEAVDRSRSQRHAEVFADFFGEGRIGVTGKNLHLWGAHIS